MESGSPPPINPLFNDPELSSLRKERRRKDKLMKLERQTVKRIHGLFGCLPEHHSSDFEHLSIRTRSEAKLAAEAVIEKYKKWNNSKHYSPVIEANTLLKFLQDPDVSDAMISQAWDLIEVERLFKQ